MKNKILIVKLGAIGDVLRTTPCLSKLRDRYDPCRITWVTAPDSAPLIKHAPQVDRVVEWGPEALARSMVEEFDIAIGLDKEPGAAALVAAVKAARKLGFSMNESGAVCCLNEGAEYTYRLGLDDELKFVKNYKTYQEMIFDIIDLDWEDDDYVLELPRDAMEAGKKQVESILPAGSGPIVGLNPGAGPRWPLKKWTVEGYASLADKLTEKITDQDRTFFESKLYAMKYFFHYELPKIEGLTKRLMESDGLTSEIQALHFVD